MDTFKDVRLEDLKSLNQLYDLIIVDEAHRGYILDREMGDAIIVPLLLTDICVSMMHHILSQQSLAAME
ncbi:MAG: hypothetical protein IJ661_07840 [Lachnospiraceae bacterium]|nr:hypothetical protein [Lachnospiraceae bacterium]